MTDIVLASEIKSALVLSFHELWTEKAGPGGIPERDAFPPEILRPWIGNIQIVDLTDGDVFHRLIGTSIVEATGRDLTGKFVSECDYTIGSDAMLARYQETASFGAPVFRQGQVIWAPDRSWRQFELVTAPLSSDGSGVEQLITVLDYL